MPLLAAIPKHHSTCPGLEDNKRPTHQVEFARSEASQMFNMASKSAAGSELIIPQFASPMRDTQVYMKSKLQHPGLNPFTAASQRLQAESCQQAVHVNMLLQQLLVRAALSNQQNISRPLCVPPLYGVMGLAKSNIFNGRNFPLPAFHPPRASGLDGTISPSVLLTPPLSERSVDSSTDGAISQESSNDLLLKPAKERVAGRKRTHKGTESSLKSKARKESEKYKASRKLDLNEQSPISGIMIKRKTKGDKSNIDTSTSNEECHGDIDSRFNVVDKSEESKKKLAEIKNVIGDFVCQLCDRKFADVYELAEHRCPSIIYIEYKCPECSKVFNCPANLASHRRWHKPRATASTRSAVDKCNKNDNQQKSKTAET